MTIAAAIAWSFTGLALSLIVGTKAEAREATTMNKRSKIPATASQGCDKAAPISIFTRLTDEPVLKPRSGLFDSAGAYNPAAAKVGRKIVLLYRAQDDKGTSYVGYAESSDGIKFNARPQAVLSPEADYEKDGGVEDPRLQKIGSLYYLTYTGYNKKDAQLCLAVSRDLVNWERKGVIMPAGKGSWNVRWTKSGAIVPRKINGRYWMYYMGDGANGGNDQMGLASSEDLIHWQDATSEPVLKRRAGKFDSRVVEPGPAPIMTKDGILLIYNGADDKLVYRVGWVLFDKKNPARVIARSDEPLLSPEHDWEKVGQVPNVVFVEGMVRRGSELLFYYGGADTTTGVASARLTR
ncbi:MAG TPA: glycoside hydrolase family 130 protein [Candidatus Obscuribacterales bacterium]